MKEDRKELARMEELAAEIERNPLTKKFREEEAAATLATRMTAADRIEALRHEAENHVTLQQEINPLVDKLAALDREREALVTEIRGKRATLARSKLDIEGDIQQQEEILFSTYDPRIDEAIAYFQGRREALFKKSIDKQTHTVKTNVFTMVKELFTISNAPSIQSAIKYCLDSIHTLESMRLEPSLDIEKIEAMKRGIPDVGEMTESRSEHPISGPWAVNPRDLLKSDSQLDWEMKKINEDFKRVMRR